jgi:hypothetical protein
LPRLCCASMRSLPPPIPRGLAHALQFFTGIGGQGRLLEGSGAAVRGTASAVVFRGLGKVRPRAARRLRMHERDAAVVGAGARGRVDQRKARRRSTPRGRGRPHAVSRRAR